MKQPYKIQNRTSDSRRVKFVKNGGTVSFPKTPTASFVENSREAGFCLTAINPLPARSNATNSITLTSHPMGTDGRVSLYIDNILIESKRFTSLNRIVDRQVWFNAEFGAYVRYTGKEQPTFTTTTVSPNVYRFVFEDDDLDYLFANTTNAVDDINPTLIVEQYRLAFDLMNNTVEISCDGATYETPYMSLTGDWQLEINGDKYTTENTPIETMLAMIAGADVSVVYEADDQPSEDPEVITDYTLYGWYNPDLQQFEGIGRPNIKLAVIYDGNLDDFIELGIIPESARWTFTPDPEKDIYSYTFYQYAGTEFNDPNTLYGSAWQITVDEHIGVPADIAATSDVIPTFEKIIDWIKLRDMCIHYRIDDGDIQLATLTDLKNLFFSNNDVSLTEIITLFAKPIDENNTVSDLGKFLTNNTNMLSLTHNNFLTYISETEIVALGNRPGNIPMEKPISVTFYRGKENGYADLFDYIFKDSPENYITITATHKINPNNFIVPTGVAAVANGDIVQVVNGVDKPLFNVWDTSDLSNIKFRTYSFDQFYPSAFTSARYLDIDQLSLPTLYNSLGKLVTEVSDSSGNNRNLVISDNANDFSMIGYTRSDDTYITAPAYVNDSLWLASDWSLEVRNKTPDSLSLVNAAIYGNTQYNTFANVRENEYLAVVSQWNGYNHRQETYFVRMKYDPETSNIDVNELTSDLIPTYSFRTNGDTTQTMDLIHLYDNTYVMLILSCIHIVTIPEDFSEGITATAVLAYSDVRKPVKVGETDDEVFVYFQSFSTGDTWFLAFSKTDASTRVLNDSYNYQQNSEIGPGGPNYFVVRDGLVAAWSNYEGARIKLLAFDIATGTISKVPYMFPGEGKPS